MASSQRALEEMGEYVKVLEAEVVRLHATLKDALTGCEVGASMHCECTGYYKCNGCVGDVAEQAKDTADLIRTALACVVSVPS